MDINSINSILSNLKSKVSTDVTTQKSLFYKKEFSAIGKKLYRYSQKCLIMDGAIPNPDQPPLTATDRAFMKAMAIPLTGHDGSTLQNNWEGNQQAISRMFSVLTGLDFYQETTKDFGTFHLQTSSIIKYKGITVIVSGGGNLFASTPDGLEKYSGSTPSRLYVEQATEDEIITFLGSAFTNSSESDLKFKLGASTIDEFDTLIDVSLHGIDVVDNSNKQFRKYITHLTPDLTVAPLEVA